MYGIQSLQLLYTHDLSNDFQNGGSFLQLEESKLLCVGPSDKVFLLELTSLELSPYPSLSISRDCAGLAQVNAHVYVFGGFDGNDTVSSCEKMQISGQFWTQISSMKYRRWGFTPCHFRSLLYLIASNYDAKGQVETFNPQEETFELLQVSLPHELTLCPDSIAFIVSGELCLLTKEKQMARWKIETESSFRFSDTNRGSLSNHQPLIIGSLALMAYSGRMQRFSLDTYSFLEE